MNFLEELVSEWYEYKGYFVRRNVLVGKRKLGGYECELVVVVFDPKQSHLVQIEPSMDADSWSKLEERVGKKFDTGKEHIPELFEGLELPGDIEQIALLGFGSKKNRKTVGGGAIQLVPELLLEILIAMKEKKIESNAVPEDKPILRTLQFVASNREAISEALTP